MSLKIYKNNLYFHNSDYEIDFITKDTAWEVKYQNNISREDVKKLLKFPKKKFVLSKNKIDITNELIIMPVEYYLLLAEEIETVGKI